MNLLERLDMYDDCPGDVRSAISMLREAEQKWECEHKSDGDERDCPEVEDLQSDFYWCERCKWLRKLREDKA